MTQTQQVTQEFPTANGAYRAVVAQHRARLRARRPKAFKLSRHRRMARRIERLLARKWSRDLAAAQTVAVVEAGGRTVSLGDLLGPEFAALRRRSPFPTSGKGRR